MTLDPVQQRVLGALIEKEIATPENYPLSLNALVNACNQRSSRDPVMELSEGDVRDALSTLEALELASVSRDSRVPKYEHRARTVFNLRRDETAVLCLLLLRGPQTPGELRARADRLYAFDDPQAVQNTLERLASRPSEGLADTGPLVSVLPRQPGSREARFTHLLGSAADRLGRPVTTQTPTQAHPESTTSSPEDDISRQFKQLAEQVESLAAAVDALNDRLVKLETLSAAAPPS